MRRSCRRSCASRAPLLLPLLARFLSRGFEQFFSCQAKPLNRRANPRPMLFQKSLAFALKQESACARPNEQAEPAPFFDQLLIDQLLIPFQNGEGIEPIFGCN